MLNENKNTASKRLFIGIPLPLMLKEYIYNKVSYLSILDEEIKAVPQLNIHITLKFLGNTSVGKIDKILRAVDLTVKKFNKFYYTAGNTIDAFPSMSAAKVVFMPIVKGENSIKEIFSELEDNLSKIKIRKEQKKFISHITVARLKNIKDISKVAGKVIIEKRDSVFCSHIAVYESILKPSGAEYNIIKEFELK